MTLETYTKMFGTAKISSGDPRRFALVQLVGLTFAIEDKPIANIGKIVSYIALILLSRNSSKEQDQQNEKLHFEECRNHMVFLTKRCNGNDIGSQYDMMRYWAIGLVYFFAQ